MTMTRFDALTDEEIVAEHQDAVACVANARVALIHARHDAELANARVTATTMQRDRAMQRRDEALIEWAYRTPIGG